LARRSQRPESAALLGRSGLNTAAPAKADPGCGSSAGCPAHAQLSPSIKAAAPVSVAASAPPSYAPASALPPPPQWPQPGGAPPRRSQTPIVIAAVIVGALAVAGVLVYEFVYPGTPEHQIKAVTQTFADGFNNADPAAVSAVCSHPATSDSFNMRTKLLQLSAADLRQLRDAEGTLTFTLSDIHVTGDRATARGTAAYSKDPSADSTDTDSDLTQFVKENGDWKLCS
jgi:ketosteroid isomerase-like protein